MEEVEEMNIELAVIEATWKILAGCGHVSSGFIM